MPSVTAGPVLRLGMLLSKEIRQSDLFLPTGVRSFGSNGRSAFLAALQRLGIPKSGRILLPSYLCDSVVAPVVSYGAVPEFYPISPKLEPDLSAIEYKLRNEKPDLLVVIHYFGFPSPGWSELRQLAEKFNIPILEDCAHALYSRPDGKFLGSDGAAAIFSLRKSLPVPEGGILVIRDFDEGLEQTETKWKYRELSALTREIVYSVDHFLGLSLRARLSARDTILDWTREKNSEAAPDIWDGVGQLSHRIIQRVDASEIIEKRRRNFMDLSGVVQELGPWLRPLYTDLADGICPVGFPVVVEERDRLRRDLARRGIGVRMFWDRLPEQITTEEFPDSAYLRDRILVLPIHQDINEYKLKYMRETLRMLWLKS